MHAALVIALLHTLLWGVVRGYQDMRIGVLLPAEDEEGVHARIVERVFGQRELQVERLEGDDPFHYHKAACRLRRAGCCAGVLSPSCAHGLPGQVAVACPGLPEVPTPPLLGMRPDTTRPTLDLLRQLDWQEITYLYDYPLGSEKLQIMFRVGYSALRLRLSGLLHVRDAQDAAQQLLRLSGRRRVLLNAAPQLVQELLTRMAHAGSTQHTFLVMQPTLADFWSSPELRGLDVIGFSFPPSVTGEFFGGPSTVERLYFHDAALFLSVASAAGMRAHSFPRPPINPTSPLPPECEPPGGASTPDTRIADILQTVVVPGGLTGRLQFSDSRIRRNVSLTVMKTSRSGPITYGWWSDFGRVGGIQRNSREGALPQIHEKRVLRITTRLSDPFMMVEGGNGSFEGFCFDLYSALCADLPLECHLYEVPDGRQGHYDPRRGTWDGMMGEMLSGRADIALGELEVTAARLRAADFLEPFLSSSLSLLLPRPQPRPAPLSWGAWGAVLAATLLVALGLHALGRLSGAPDSIEAASAIWERRSTPVISAWFTLGSALLQPTGVYPRSLSSRVLACSWFAFTGFVACMLVASMAAQLQLRNSSGDSPQLRQLQALSLESILAESLENEWPEIAVVSPSFTEDVLQESSVPLLTRLRERVRRVSSEEEGASLAVEGGFALLTESPWAERAAARRPCHLVAVSGSGLHGALAIALAPALEPELKSNVRAAFEKLHASGYIGHLHRKWWIENNQCNEGQGSDDSGAAPTTVLLILVGASAVLLLLSFAVQFFRKIRTKESRRQQLTFEDINFDQRLPTPPPELLDPPPVSQDDFSTRL